MATSDLPDTAPSPKAKEPAYVSGRRVPTYEDLIKKRRRVRSFTIFLPTDDGESVEYEMKYQAISPAAYDKLVADHPPTKKQRDDGAGFNIDTFAPALIAAVSLEPRLTQEQAGDLYSSEDWSGGEVSTLYMEAVRLCSTGLDVPFTGRD